MLRPKAAHSNLNGTVNDATRLGRGRVNFVFEVVRLWERPAETFLNGALGTLPFVVLGTLSEGVPPEDALTAVAQTLNFVKTTGKWIDKKPIFRLDKVGLANNLPFVNWRPMNPHWQNDFLDLSLSK